MEKPGPGAAWPLALVSFAAMRKQGTSSKASLTSNGKRCRPPKASSMQWRLSWIPFSTSRPLLRRTIDQILYLHHADGAIPLVPGGAFLQIGRFTLHGRWAIKTPAMAAAIQLMCSHIGIACVVRRTRERCEKCRQEGTVVFCLQVHHLHGRGVLG